MFIPPEGAMQFEVAAKYKELFATESFWVTGPIPGKTDEVGCQCTVVYFPVLDSLPPTLAWRWASMSQRYGKPAMVCVCSGKIIE